MNSDKSKLRRYEDNLNVSGIGVIILGAWSIVKIFMQILLSSNGEMTVEEFEDGGIAVAVVVILIIVAVILLISFLIFKIHLYIGLNASKDAKGQPHKKGYYVGAIIILVLSVLSFTAYFDDFKDLDNIETTLASFLVDLTTIYILGTLIYSSKMVKQLRTEKTQE